MQGAVDNEIEGSPTVTGSVNANTAIGMLEASMLDMATTSSMTNNRNVAACSLPLMGMTRRKAHETPKSMSSTINRVRQACSFTAPGG
jgi:hypothetical protein